MKLDHLLLFIGAVTWLQTQVPATFPMLSRGMADSGESNDRPEVGEEVGREVLTASAPSLERKALLLLNQGIGLRLRVGGGLRD